MHIKSYILYSLVMFSFLFLMTPIYAQKEELRVVVGVYENPPLLYTPEGRNNGARGAQDKARETPVEGKDAHEEGQGTQDGEYVSPGEVGTKRAAGLFADLLEYIAVREKWNLEYRSGNWDQALERLETGG